MLFNVLCLITCAFLIGIILGLLLARPVVRQRMLEVETYWKQQLIAANNNWSTFHKAEYNKWVDQTEDLIYKAIDERDRAWEKKLSGKKLPKPPTNN